MTFEADENIETYPLKEIVLLFSSIAPRINNESYGQTLINEIK